MTNTATPKDDMDYSGSTYTPVATPADEVCANCKGVIGELPEGREPEEFCDTCYEDSQALSSTPTTPADPLGDVRKVGTMDRQVAHMGR